MKLTIRYFAILRDQAGVDSEFIHIESTDPQEVYAFLQEKYSFSLSQSRLKLAVNEEFVDWDYQLKDGDCLVFIPPVAGG